MQNLENSLRIVQRRSLLWPFTRTLGSIPDGGASVPSYIPIANDFARRMAKRMGGMPFSTVTEVLFDIPVTAHILGGCKMSESAKDGVINFQNRVHGYQNMFICDGSIVTTNLGVNPALSITAFTERAMAMVPKVAEVRNLKAEQAWGVAELLNPNTPQ